MYLIYFLKCKYINCVLSYAYFSFYLKIIFQVSWKIKFLTNVKRPKICLWSKTNGLTNWERLPLSGFYSGPTARACGRCCLLLLYGLLNWAGRFSFQIAAARGADSAGQPEGCVEAGGGLGAAWLDQVPAHADAGALYVGGSKMIWCGTDPNHTFVINAIQSKFYLVI